MLNFHSSKSSIGIEFSDSSVCMAEVHSQQGVIGHIRIPLEDGIIVRGVVTDKKRLVSKIREAVSKLPNPPGAAHGLLPESITYLHSFFVNAGLSGNDLEQTVQKEAEGIIPLAPGLFYSHFIAVPDTAAKDRNIITYGASEKLAVDAYAQAMRDAGVTPLSLGIKPFSLARVFLTQNTPAYTAVVYMGETETSLGIYSSHPAPLISVSLPVGMHTMIADISAKLNVPFAQAAELIQVFGVDYKKPQNKVFLIIQATFQRIINEIRPAVSFYESKYPQQKIGRIILAGQPALLPRAHEYWEVNMGRKVELGSQQTTMELAGAVGAALGGLHANSLNINLLGGRSANARHSQDYFRLLGSTFARAQSLAPEIPKTAQRTLELVGAALLTLAAIGGLGWTVWKYALISPSPTLPPSTSAESTVDKSPEATVGTAPSEPLTVVEASSTPLVPVASATSTPAVSPSPAPSNTEEFVTITDTPTGWLRVRESPNTTAAEIARIMPGEKYVLLEEDESWYRIRLDGERTGWISAQYAEKK